MTNRTLVKMTAMEHCILFRTITRAKKSPHTFYITRDAIAGLRDKGEITEHDGNSFAILRRNDAAGTMSIRFTWLSGGEGGLTGWEETVTLPYEKLLNFMERTAQTDGPKEWNTLSVKTSGQPKLEFCGKKNLHMVLGNPAVRRKLVKFLRDKFQWKGADKVCFYNDFVPYSFFFQEFCNGQPGMCGGLILHGQENMAEAYYSIHT